MSKKLLFLIFLFTASVSALAMLESDPECTVVVTVDDCVDEPDECQRCATRILNASKYICCALSLDSDNPFNSESWPEVCCCCEKSVDSMARCGNKIFGKRRYACPVIGIFSCGNCNSLSGQLFGLYCLPPPYSAACIFASPFLAAASNIFFGSAVINRMDRLYGMETFCVEKNTEKMV